MKKWFALLTALLCLLAGSALASGGQATDSVKILGTNIHLVAGTQDNMKNCYKWITETGEVTDGTPDHYNVKVIMKKDENNLMIAVVTFKNANFTAKSDAPIVEYNGAKRLFVIGEGTNRLVNQGTADAFHAKNHNGGAGRDIIIQGNFDTIETNGANAIYSKYGNIQIDGTIGSIKVNAGDADGFGLHAEDGKVKINNSVGPITVSGTGNSNSAVRAKNGIELGDGISLVAPENGSFTQADDYTHVVNAGGAVSQNAKFGKAAAPTVPPAPTDSSSAPKTGDDMNLILWAILLALSIIGVSALSRKEKKVH